MDIQVVTQAVLALKNGFSLKIDVTALVPDTSSCLSDAITVTMNDSRLYLPKHRVEVGSVKLVRHPGRRQFWPEQRDKFLKAHLAVTWQETKKGV